MIVLGTPCTVQPPTIDGFTYTESDPWAISAAGDVLRTAVPTYTYSCIFSFQMAYEFYYTNPSTNNPEY